jgi:hypothetical protein
MLESTFFKIVDNLKPTFLKQNTKYQKAIYLEIHLSCVIYKLAHCCNFLICNEMFTIKKFPLSLVFHEFVVTVNLVIKRLIFWLERLEM